MFWIKASNLPDQALLSKYRSADSDDSRAGYHDCYSTVIDGVIRQSDYVFAFYTTGIFKLERLILKYLVDKPSTDTQARQLSEGKIDSFAAWDVEDRTEDQLLMCDLHGRTRSWLMVSTEQSTEPVQSRLYFGSAVLRVKQRKTEKYKMGIVFSLLLGFHKIYSRILLRAARSRLQALRN